MHFTTDQEDSTTIFRLKEPRLDSRNAGQLKAEFLILAQPDIDTLIVDLTDVGHVDSAGLSALLLAQRQMKSHDGDIRLVGVNDAVRSLLNVTQLDRIFPLFDTVDAALDAEPSLEGDDDEEEFAAAEMSENKPLGPGAPSAKDIKSGAIAAGGSFGAAALAQIMMTPYEEELDNLNGLAFGDDEGFDDDDDLEDDLDDDFEEDEEFADEVDDDDDEEEEAADADAEAVEEVDEDDVLEDDDLEDDDWDDEELEEDEEEDI
jgi:anti-sigma B factor antagonist